MLAPGLICICLCPCGYVCLCVCMLCMYACVYVYMYVCMFVCMYVSMHVCMCACVYYRHSKSYFFIIIYINGYIYGACISAIYQFGKKQQLKIR